MGTTVDKIDKVVALTCLGRSGSVFVQSLLDGHEQVLTTPGIALYSFYEFFADHKLSPLRELVDSFVSFYRVLFDSRTASEPWRRIHGDLGLTRLGPQKDDHLEVSSEEFKRQILLLTENRDQPVSRAWFFKAVHLSYKLCLTPTFVPNEQTTIVFPLHIPGLNKYSKLMTEDFPEARFITSVREPIRAFSSWVAHDRALGAGGISTMLTGGYPVSEEARQRCAVVRIEDINGDLEGSTRELCQWLGLTWQDSMLDSTFNGMSWWGDKAAPTPDRSNTNGLAGEEVLPAADIERLRILIYRQMHQWGYAAEGSAPAKAVYWLTILGLLLYPFAVESMAALELRRASMKRPRTTPFLKFKYFVALTGVRQIVDIFKARPELFSTAVRHYKAKPTMTIKQLSDLSAREPTPGRVL